MDWNGLECMEIFLCIPHLGDQDVLEAPVLVLGRLDVVLPGLTSGLYHLNISQEIK